MKKKQWFFIGLFVLLIGGASPYTQGFAAETSSATTNGTVGFYGDVNYEGDPDPEPPATEQPTQKPGDTQTGSKPGGKLPQTNETMSMSGPVVGVCILLFVTLKWMKGRLKQEDITTQSNTQSRNA